MIVSLFDSISDSCNGNTKCTVDIIRNNLNCNFIDLTNENKAVTLQNKTKTQKFLQNTQEDLTKT